MRGALSSTPSRRRWPASSRSANTSSPLFGAVDQPDLPDYIDYEDDAQAYIPEAFAYVIGRAIEELMKAVQT
jgi:hypothetical protein